MIIKFDPSTHKYVYIHPKEKELQQLLPPLTQNYVLLQRRKLFLVALQ